MSLTTLTTQNIKSTHRRKAMRPEAVDPGDMQEPAVQSAIEIITAYIPSEVIGLYVAGIGILEPEGDMKWLLFGFALFLIPIVIWLSLIIKRGQNSHFRLELPAKQFCAITSLAVLAFVAWAAALPRTPFETFSVNATRYGGFAVLVLAAILPRIGQLLGLRSPEGGA